MTKRLTREEMLALPADELREYLAGGGDWTVGAQAVTRKGRSVQRPAELPVDEINPSTRKVMQVISVRLPVDLVTALDELAGRDKDGRSGLIRQGAERVVNELRRAS